MDKNLPANAGDTGSIPGQEDSTCCRATKSMYHNFWACPLAPGNCNYRSLHAWACVLQREKSPQGGAHEPHPRNWKSPGQSNKDPMQPKINQSIEKNFKRTSRMWACVRWFRGRFSKLAVLWMDGDRKWAVLWLDISVLILKRKD